VNFRYQPALPSHFGTVLPRALVVSPFRLRSLTPSASHFSSLLLVQSAAKAALFCTPQKPISCPFKHIHTLSAKTPGVGYPSLSRPNFVLSLRPCLAPPPHYLLSFHIFCRPPYLSPVFSHISKKYPGGGYTRPSLPAPSTHCSPLNYSLHRTRTTEHAAILLSPLVTRHYPGRWSILPPVPPPIPEFTDAL